MINLPVVFIANHHTSRCKAMSNDQTQQSGDPHKTHDSSLASNEGQEDVVAHGDELVDTVECNSRN